MANELPLFNTDPDWLAYCATLEPVLAKMAQKFCGGDSGMMDDVMQEARIAIYGIFPDKIKGDRSSYVRNVARNAMLNWLHSYKTGPLDTGRTEYRKDEAGQTYKVHKPPRFTSYDHLSDEFGLEVNSHGEATWGGRHDGIELEPVEQPVVTLPEAVTENDYRETRTTSPERRWTVHYGWRTRLNDKRVALAIWLRNWLAAQKKKLAKSKKPAKRKPAPKAPVAKPSKVKTERPAATKPKPVAPEQPKAVKPEPRPAPVERPAKRKHGPTRKTGDELACGTSSKYRKGCRCDACKEAEREREREKYRRKREREGQTVAPRKAAQHGTSSMYTRHGCRCDACRAAHSDKLRKFHKARKEALAAGETPSGPEPEHGTTQRYQAWGCRCDLCREAINAYNRDRYAKRKNKNAGQAA